MKTIHLLFLLLLPVLAFTQTEETQPSVDQQEDPIFKVVEEQPTFPGCENVKDQSKREKCASSELRKYLRDNLDYPPLALENGVEGYVVVNFIIEKDGSISNAEIVRDIGAGCGKELLR